jgi:hypothetical protein
MGNLSAQGVPQSRPMPKKGSAPKLKPLVAGKPNPNIGMGLKTSSDLPQFGEVGWVNPNWDPNHNADGYHRFDPTIPGMGLQYSKTYADGARVYDSYQKSTPGAGYASTSNRFLTDNGINPATATDIQKFAAMDFAGREAQWKNQRPKRKFGIKDAFGLALSVGAIFTGNPYLAAGLAAGGSAVQGGSLGDIALAGGLAFGGAKLGGTPGSTLKPGVKTAITLPGQAAKTLSTAARIGAGVGNVARTVAPFVGSGLVVGNALNQSGVTRTPTQFSNLRGGNREITTFEPENKNIASSAHPTSAYAGAYPGLANVANAGTRPINAAPIAPINTPGRNAAPYAAPKPYVAPPRIQIAPNMPIIKYDPRRNYPQTTTMQQALMRPAATRAPA